MKVRLDSVCEKASTRYSQKDLMYLEGKYPIYGASGFIKNIDKYDQEKEYIAIIKDGASVGKTMLLPAKSSIIGTLQYLIPRNNIETKYLYYAIKALHLERYNTGATIPHIYFKDYRKESIELPCLQKQKEIVRVFEKLEILISNSNKQIKLLDTLVKSRFVEMFGDPVINSKDWPVRQFSEYINFLTSGSRGWAKYFTNEGEYFITIKNVKNCHVTVDDIQYVIPPDNAEARRTKVQKGDLLISITADLGRTGVVSEEIASHGGYINQHLTCIRVKKDVLNPLYVAYFMESDAGKTQFQSKNQSAVKAGLNFNSINSLRLSIPPLTLQNQFADFVKQIDKSKFEIQRSLEETQKLYDSLMQKYFG